MTLGEDRLVATQQTFRDANERLQAALDPQVPPESLLPFLCECPDEECFGRIELVGGDYEAIHVHRDRYVVIPGHPTVVGEEVVETQPHFQVMRKV